MKLLFRMSFLRGSWDPWEEEGMVNTCSGKAVRRHCAQDPGNGKTTHLSCSCKVEGLGFLIGVSGSDNLPGNMAAGMIGLITEKGSKVYSVTIVY